MLLPIALDLFLWFGPHVKVKELFLPLVAQLQETMQSMNQADLSGLMVDNQQIWEQILDRTNLISALRTLPVGVPSLLSNSGVIANPIGTAAYVEVHSFMTLAGAWFLLFLLGALFGVLYFAGIARLSAKPVQPVHLGKILLQYGQTIFLTVLLVAILILLGIPTSLMISILTLISPFIAQLAVFLMSIVFLWLLFPLIFSPHGIFVSNQNAVQSMLTSARMVRYLLPSASLFLLVLLMLNQGLDLIWQMAPEQSWMTLVGIAGHAFVSTALISASFYYYRSGLEWMQTRMKRPATTLSQV
ncbi:MAG: hypothetical protein GYA17_02680 [Chloroflexi bacterium]|nr:hypothetical protein [Chloroflexota bacterium]